MCTIWLYYVFVIVSVILDVTSLFTGLKEGNIQKLGAMVNIVVSLLFAFLSFRIFADFRTAGGIYGEGLHEALIEDKLLEAVSKGNKKLGLVSKGMGLFDKAIDRSNQEEKGIEIEPLSVGFGSLLAKSKSFAYDKLEEGIEAGSKAATDKISDSL